MGYSVEVFTVIREYLYTSEMPSLNFDVIGEVFEAGDMLLLPGLRSDATAWVINHHLVQQENVLEAYQLSQTFSLTKMEEHCIHVMADNLESILEEEGLPFALWSKILNQKHKQNKTQNKTNRFH